MNFYLINNIAFFFYFAPVYFQYYLHLYDFNFYIFLLILFIIFYNLIYLLAAKATFVIFV